MNEPNLPSGGTELSVPGVDPVAIQGVRYYLEDIGFDLSVSSDGQRYALVVTDIAEIIEGDTAAAEQVLAGIRETAINTNLSEAAVNNHPQPHGEINALDDGSPLAQLPVLPSRVTTWPSPPRLSPEKIRTLNGLLDAIEGQLRARHGNFEEFEDEADRLLSNMPNNWSRVTKQIGASIYHLIGRKLYGDEHEAITPTKNGRQITAFYKNAVVILVREVMTEDLMRAVIIERKLLEFSVNRAIHQANGKPINNESAPVNESHSCFTSS